MWQTKGNMAHSFIAFGIFNAMSEVGGPEVNLDVGCRFCILDSEFWIARSGGSVIAFSWVYCFPTRGAGRILKGRVIKH